MHTHINIFRVPQEEPLWVARGLVVSNAQSQMSAAITIMGYANPSTRSEATEMVPRIARSRASLVD
jgi:hypothetical protein